MLEGSDG